MFFNLIFEVNVVGTYEFMLDVWDMMGVKSCILWVKDVVVLLIEVIYVELVWIIFNDLDEIDEGLEVGLDMDLYFAYNEYVKSGLDLDNDGVLDLWFDQFFDCFWFNVYFNWGVFDLFVDDDLGLDWDDIDGVGFENLNLNILENGVTYCIGVHYWSDYEYGFLWVMVWIYIWGVLVFVVKDVKLVNYDMWDVVIIDWFSVKVLLVEMLDGGFKVMLNY